MKISAIVSNFNGARYLPRLLETLHGQQGVELEIVVVDRNSQDDSLQILEKDKSVVVVSEPPQSGLVSGYSRGAEVASGDHFFFINEDMWFDQDCLRYLQSNINLDKKIAAADPWQWTYDGQTLIHAGVRFCVKRWNINSPYPWKGVEFDHPLASGDLIPFACAGAFLIHRRVYEEVGGWDRSFFLDDEDTDLGIRLWRNGWKTVTEPRARVYHAVSASNVQKLPGSGQLVSHRRYISTYSNKAVIGLKYFGPSYQWVVLLAWFVRFGSNLSRLRWRVLKWDLAVWKEIWSRFPEIKKYRSAHSPVDPRRFYDEPIFQK